MIATPAATQATRRHILGFTLIEGLSRCPGSLFALGASGLGRARQQRHRGIRIVATATQQPRLGVDAELGPRVLDVQVAHGQTSAATVSRWPEA
jgi:hypothetical protein